MKLRYTGPKVKLSRKLGFALTPKAAKVMENKPHPPGQHGVERRRGKISDYKMQLLEKQKLRFQYDIHERQMRNYYKKAAKMSGNTGDNLLQLLETRLLSVVLRGGLGKTIYQARQIINHGHILVNSKKVTVPGYAVKPGDTITVSHKVKKNDMFFEALKQSYPPEYIEQDKANLAVKLIAVPEQDQIPVICNVTNVIEYYSR